MKASEAREIAKKLGGTNMPKVYNEIKRAANRGELYCFYYNTLTPAEIKQLESDGYKVEQSQDRDGLLVTIKWSEKEYSDVDYKAAIHNALKDS